VAATRAALSLWRRLAALLGSLLGGLLAIGGARAADLPEDMGEGLLHVYNGGGVTAAGPAFLVRKSVADRFSLTGSYYMDAVSNASNTGAHVIGTAANADAGSTFQRVRT